MQLFLTHIPEALIADYELIYCHLVGGQITVFCSEENKEEVLAIMNWRMLRVLQSWRN